jgi:hypothetical protein
MLPEMYRLLPLQSESHRMMSGQKMAIESASIGAASRPKAREFPKWIRVSDLSSHTRPSPSHLYRNEREHQLLYPSKEVAHRHSEVAVINLSDAR